MKGDDRKIWKWCFGFAMWRPLSCGIPCQKFNPTEKVSPNKLMSPARFKIIIGHPTKKCLLQESISFWGAINLYEYTGLISKSRVDARPWNPWNVLEFFGVLEIWDFSNIVLELYLTCWNLVKFNIKLFSGASNMLFI